MTLAVQKRTVRVKLTTKQIYQKLPLPSRGHLIPSGFLGAVQRPFGCLEHLVRDGLSSIRVGDADRDRDREVFPRWTVPCPCIRILEGAATSRQGERRRFDRFPECLQMRDGLSQRLPAENHGEFANLVTAALPGGRDLGNLRRDV